jgi:hypothetical protein
MLIGRCNSSMTVRCRFRMGQPSRDGHGSFTQRLHHRADPATPKEQRMNDFLRTLEEQRWDDHRYYHHSRINQSLHLLSAISFVIAYALLFVDPAMAAILAWCVSMTSRQAGHFFFEPRGYDHVNDVTDAYKEQIKVGYNIRRKVALMAAWVAVPVALWLQPSLFGLVAPAGTFAEYLHDVGIAWLALGVAGLLLRVLQLWVQQGPVPALAWAAKILSDPFHDIKLYHRAPLALLRGELIDPMPHARRP